MPATTRSSNLARPAALFPSRKPASVPSPIQKRSRSEEDVNLTVKRQKAAKVVKTTAALKSSTKGDSPSEPLKPFPEFRLVPAHADPSRVIPANLSFDFEAAKSHLINVDSRFAQVFETLRCRPFQDLEPVDPFRSLCTSIVGQQVSWLAARAINHKFRRLFDPSLPEKAGTDSGGLGAETNSFPAPSDVLKLDVAQLRTAGLSGRKAEYVRSLAEHFESGKLTTKFLSEDSVEDVSKALIDVRGIGQWTVDMFLMFTLRRPDIMPVGDLGVQKGLLKWIVAASEPFVPPATAESAAIPPPDISSVVPIGTGFGEESVPTSNIAFPPSEPATQKKAEQKGLEKALLALQEPRSREELKDMFPLPEGMDLALLKSRLSGKKAKGNVYLTASEMESLTQNWKPYRSLAVYYMWAVAEETT